MIYDAGVTKGTLMHTAVPSAPSAQSAPSVAHGGVIYVGPSLTRSLLGVIVAVARATP